MKVVLHSNTAEHQKTHAAWMGEGLRRHGHETAFAPIDFPVDCDLAVVWGGRQTRVIENCKRNKTPLLVMERGHLPDRFGYCSCGFNGLQNYAEYPAINDSSRWEENFWHLMQPWAETDGAALVVGQVKGDASLGKLNIEQWVSEVTRKLIASGRRVIYRPHPLSRLPDGNFCPDGAWLSLGTLEQDLAESSFAVTYCSTAGVEAALAGVPVVALNKGSMAWPVSSHSLMNPITTPDREKWAHRLAWTQWTPAEISSGLAWEVLKTCKAMAR